MRCSVLGAIAIAALIQLPTSTVWVRVVDVRRSPLPGITVNARAISDCATLRVDETARQLSAVTKVDGSVEFAVASDRAYVVTVDSQGRLEGQQDCLEQVGSGTAYSQVELRPDLSQQVTLVQLRLRKRQHREPWSWGTLKVPTTDAAGQFYEVMPRYRKSKLDLEERSSLGLYQKVVVG